MLKKGRNRRDINIKSIWGSIRMVLENIKNARDYKNINENLAKDIEFLLNVTNKGLKIAV